MAVRFDPIITQTLSRPEGTVKVHVYPDGAFEISGIGGLKPVYYGKVSYWAASPAVISPTLTTFGTARSDLVPNGATLTAIGTAITQASVVNAIKAAAPTYSDSF